MSKRVRISVGGRIRVHLCCKMSKRVRISVGGRIRVCIVVRRVAVFCQQACYHWLHLCGNAAPVWLCVYECALCECAHVYEYIHTSIYEYAHIYEYIYI